MFKNQCIVIFLLLSLLSIGCSHTGATHEGSLTQVKDGNILFTDADVMRNEWRKTNSIAVHIKDEPDNLHPAMGGSFMKTFIFRYTQKSLVAIDFENGTLRPELVEELPSLLPNGTSYTYTIKKGITWDDGSPLTAEDVIFTFKANICPLINNQNVKSYLSTIEDIIIDPLNPLKLVFKMKDASINNISCTTGIPIMERKFIDPDNVLSLYSLDMLRKKSSLNPATDNKLIAWSRSFNSVKYCREIQYMNGLGAYKVSSWDEGQSIVLERKQKKSIQSRDIYNNADPEKIIFKVNKDPNSQLLEFKSQVYDASVSISSAILAELQKDTIFNKNYNSAYIDAYWYSYIAMNTKPDGIKHKKLFIDKNVRKAIALLSPVDNILKTLNLGKNKRVVGPVFPYSNEYDSSLTLVPYNVERAKQLLDNAGWKDSDNDRIRDKIINGEKIPFTFDFSYINNPINKDIALMIMESFALAGLKINLKPLDANLLYEQAQNHDFDAVMGVWNGDALPQDFSQLWHTTSWLNKGSNYTGFGGKISDDLIENINKCNTHECRLEFVKKLQKIIYDECPYVFLFQGTTKVIVHKRFGNVTIYKEKPYLLINNWKLLNK